MICIQFAYTCREPARFLFPGNMESFLGFLCSFNPHPSNPYWPRTTSPDRRPPERVCGPRALGGCRTGLGSSGSNLVLDGQQSGDPSKWTLLVRGA